MVDVGIVAEILTLVLAILATYWGMKLRRVKKVLNDIVNAMETTAKAIEDNKVTPDEVKEMIGTWKKVLDNVRD